MRIAHFEEVIDSRMNRGDNDLFIEMIFETLFAAFCGANSGAFAVMNKDATAFVAASSSGASGVPYEHRPYSREMTSLMGRN